ncbi:MAG: NADPH:quinone reductase-like Zn-dependent oxidoreductase, partial [Pseudohongiellaceae bacterium]
MQTSENSQQTSENSQQTSESSQQTSESSQQTMGALVHREYGSFDVLSVQQVPRPAPKHDEVLVRVRAAGLHVGDCFMVRGAPFVMRLVGGLLKPKTGIPGFDLAGHVEAVGSSVTEFLPGDEIFGSNDGTCAEYVCPKEKTLALKPGQLTFEQAAAIPTSALAALHALRDAGKVQPGHKVLINGASGGVGTFAVQIAKFLGAEVTGVCSTQNVETVRSLGADHVIDYTRDDFTQGGPRFDVILDNVENRTLSHCRRALTPDGTLILNSGTGAKGFAFLKRLLKPLIVSPFVGQKLRRYISLPNREDLIALRGLVDSGKLIPVLDEVCTLADAPAALARIEGGHVCGKIVTSVSA